ncbi:MAG: hypothetical protein ACRDPC_13540, partial [Solirubrobacteraceae bacterium]
AEAERPAPAAPLDRVLAMQRSAGNRAVASILSRHGDHGTHAPEQAAGGTGTAPALTQAGQEAEALATWALLRTVHRQMLASTDTRIRNTGQMLNPPGARSEGRPMSVKPMTLRSDSAQLVADRGDNVAETAYYFYGSTQDNEHQHGPNTIGTIEGDSTVLVRGKLSGGTWQSHDDLMGTLVHECSHIIVKDYGEHPETATDAGSFDRYKDEFRAYFVEPHGGFAGLTGAARAAAIKTHLVGTNATTGGYPDLRAAYWAGTAATNTFRQQVDAHTTPDGFNLSNSPYLHRLVTLLREQRTGGATVEDSIFQITILAPAERSEAAGATLIATLLSNLPAADARRIRQALTSPASVGYGRELNPSGSARITAFLEAVTTRAPDQIVEAYRLVPGTERHDLQFNAHLLSWLGRVLPSERLLRTCVIGMVTGRSFVYFDRVRAFAQACTAAAGAAEMPEALRTALRGLSLEVRMGYYRFSEDDYRERVVPLQEPVRREVTAILRGDREP